MEKSADQNTQEHTGMAPKDNYDPSTNTNGNVDERDLQEMADVSDTIDQISSALDFFEQRTDNIIEQLKELLHSNKQIREELAQEKASMSKNVDQNN